MQVTSEPLDPCQVTLTIEVEGPKVVHAVDRAYKEYSKYVAAPGFRKGKAPLSLVRQRVPESEVRQRVSEILIEPAFEEAIAQEGLPLYAPPRFELLEMELADKPFKFKAIVALPPQVTLGEYTGIAAEHKNYTVADADVDVQIDKLRQRAADYPIVERPIQMGDLVVADVGAETDVRPEAAVPRAAMIEIGGESSIPGFDEFLLGMTAGEEKSFPLTYPEEYADSELAGETAQFTVLVKEVREKQVPEMDDALAIKLSNGKLQTLDALRGNLREDMERSLRESADTETSSTIVEQVVENATITYPPILLDKEVEGDAAQLSARLEREKISVDEYLQRTGKTREDVLAELRTVAEKRVRVTLVLNEVAKAENLSTTDADVDAALAEQAAAQGASPAALRAYLESSNSLDALRGRTQTKKILDFLRGAAVIAETQVSAGEVLASAEDDDDEESE